MSLDPSLDATLAADINASTDQRVIDALALDPPDLSTITNVYNEQASPDFWVWKESLPETDIYRMTSPDATTWDWTFYAGMNPGEQDAWARMLGPNATLEMSLPQVRSGLDAIYSGPQGGADANAHIKALGRTLATTAEKLFATGTGSTAAPATRVFVGNLTLQEVRRALGL